ncbi:putative EamA domain-containing protein [Helianthus annuus]|uniref:WAT1-related protein n=1 Tax=Helianthus annuus TaxID=4232 RepID=A0A9K3DGV9_HELAN|nr:putative EamA domain-containing protein [Helianthus annuus]KAJ0428876.1 putative EamA domain-containing protein [Helianthus annuus]KAJ0433075.1 putative EamA domain-containing protein [Helianthus annuus]KAJ0447218.1 putative EamA domain-containing protein [Helianthus annuus]KAJ0632128.1 putative EamA domain-containing protein [Helianthus annuus]
MAISGAMVFTFYQGPEIFVTIPTLDSANERLLLSQPWTWVYGGAIIFIAAIFRSIWNVLQPNPSAWALQPGVGSIAIVLGAIYSTAFHSNVQTWCLKKKGPLFVAMFSPLSIVIGVILGVTFLGDSLHLGSAIGTVVITAGFYIVMWGQAKEKNMLVVMINEDIVVADELGSSDQNAPLLSCSMESKC